MKKILFPIDFSPASTNALKFAVTIANQMSGQLIIAHAYTTTLNSRTTILTLKQQAEKKIREIIEKIQSDLDVKASPLVMRADTVPFLSHLSKSVDLVVMGTEKKSIFSDLVWGRISNLLMQQTNTPVLIIPQTYPFKTFKNIVLSLDSQPINDHKGLQVLKDLVKQFNSELTLFHTEEKAADSGIHDKVFAAFSKEVGYAIDYNFVQKSIPKSIEEMIEDYEVDLIGLIRRKRSFIENLFHRSITEKEVLNSKIPLLILQET